MINEIEERPDDYVIIGNGAAGYYAASSIRKNNASANIKIISDEKVFTYYRPMLSSYLSQELSDKRFYLSTEAWYRDNSIELILGMGVVEIRPEEKEIVLSNNKVIAFDKLVIANGSSNFIPPTKGIDLKGVYTLKSKIDAEEIKSYMKVAKNAIVVGGGILGLEAAWEMKKCGLNVSVIEMDTKLMPRQLDAEGSEFFKTIADTSGIEITLGDRIVEILCDSDEIKSDVNSVDLQALASEATNLEAIASESTNTESKCSEGSINKGNPCVVAVKLASGKVIKTDLVLFSIGIRPNKAIVNNTDIVCNNGIIVNDKMETNMKDIFACGDVAEHNSRIYGNWIAAMEMGKTAGRNASGEQVAFNVFVPSVIFRGLNTEIYSTGNTDFKNSELHILGYKNPEKGIYKKLFFKDNLLSAGILIGDISKAVKLTNAIKKKLNMEEAIKENIL